MRNIMMVLAAGPILFGCLDSGGSGSSGDDTADGAPRISGIPPSDIQYGETYDFLPSASDPDGDPLTFTVQNKPGWASFDASTGRITGLPTIGDVGVYDNIVISVSDGTNRASLSAFSVTVNQTALGAVTLSWSAPTQNADGSPLNDLAGYRIYYGRNSGSYDQNVQIDNPSVTTYVVEQLSPATYYFAATSFNSAGVESGFSGEAIYTVN